MNAFSIFVAIWLSTILIAFFVQGLWGERLAKGGWVSPIPVAFLWPIGIAICAICSPFAVAYFVGRALSNSKGSGS